MSKTKEKISRVLGTAAFALFIAIGFAVIAVLAFSLAGVLLYPIIN